MSRAGAKRGRARSRQQILAERVHCSRVEGEIQIERAEPDVAVLHFGFQAVDLLDRTRNRHRMGGVDRSDLGRATEFGENGARSIVSERERRHAARTLGLLLMTAAHDDDAPGIGQRQRARGPGRCDLADTMPEMGGGADTDGSQCPDDADLDGKQQRLRDVGARQQLGVRPRFREARSPTSRVPAGADRRPPRPQRRKTALVRNASRPMPANCAPLPENTKASLSSRTAVSVITPGVGAPSRKSASVPAVVACILPERDQPVRMMIAPARGSTQQHGRPLAGRRGERAAPAPDEFAERRLGAGRDDQWGHGSGSGAHCPRDGAAPASTTWAFVPPKPKELTPA